MFVVKKHGDIAHLCRNVRVISVRMTMVVTNAIAFNFVCLVYICNLSRSQFFDVAYFTHVAFELWLSTQKLHKFVL